jgi:hypothetical protein
MQVLHRHGRWRCVSLPALIGLSLRLLPEYLLLVVVLGALRGPLFAAAIGMHAGVLAVLIFAVAGALLPFRPLGRYRDRRAA